MRTQSNILFTSISSIALQTLTMEVKETIAIVAPAASKRSFSPADLWKIQRNRRTALSRRNFSLS
jgi:hypothetical protein